MSEQEGKPPALAWGDIVRIHGVYPSKDKKGHGLILAKGFTDRNLVYQKYEELKDVNFYRESLFQVLPRSNFDMNDKLIGHQDKKIEYLFFYLSKNEKEKLKKKADEEIQSIFKLLNGIVEEAKEQKAQKGAQQNEEIQKKGFVLYGNEVIFKHVESNAYLKGLVQAAEEGGDGAFKVQLGENPCSLSTFQIRSHRTYIKDGDVTYYDDELLIFHPGSDCYTNFSEKTDNPIYLDSKIPNKIQLQDFPQDHESYSYLASRPASKKPKDIRISVINENKDKCLWKFIRHCDYEQSKAKELIKSHDIVYFKHTQKGGLVASHRCKQIYFLKEFVEQGQTQSFDCYWELIPKDTSKDNRFWARNIVSGQMLRFGQFDVEVEPDNKEDDEEQKGQKGFKDQGLVKLICTENGELMDKGNPIGKDLEAEPIILTYQQKFNNFEFKAVEELGEDSFSINRVDENTMLDIGFVISSHQPIVKFLDHVIAKLFDTNQPFEWKKFFKFDQDSLANLCKILTSLCGRIYGTTYEDIGPSGNTPKPHVQKIMVETGVAELAIQIIHHLYGAFVFIDSDKDPSDDRPIRNKITEIFEYSYRLLEKIAAGNQTNRIYMSRWVNLFLMHSKKINQAYIQQCLVGILQNNPTSIELTINESIIEELIQACFTQIENTKGGAHLTTKYLKLFSTFIKCQDRVIKQNQRIILNKFFKTENNKMSFKFKIETKDSSLGDEHPYINKEVHIAFDKEFCSIRKFYKDWKSRWDYFMAYVDLLADICMDRNHEAIENVSALLSLRILVIIMLDEEMKQLNKEILIDRKGEVNRYAIINAIQPFLRVAHYVYISNEKFTPIKRIKKISNWYKYQNREGPIIEEINRTKRPFEGEKEEEEKKFLIKILDFIKEYLADCNQSDDNLSMLYTVLNLLEQTIVLGLWQKIQSFRDMIPDIVMKITKIETDFMIKAKDMSYMKEILQFNKKRLKMNRPQINKVTECKIKATIIFGYMSEMEVDIRLRYMMNFFKGLYQATEKFQTYNIEESGALTSGDQSVVARNEKAKEVYQQVDKSSLLGEVKKISEDQQIMMKPNIWYNKLRQMTPFEYVKVQDPVKDRYLFSAVVQSSEYCFEDIVLSLFELSAYNNCGLLSNSLNMIRTMFQQRASLIESMKAIIICGKGNLYQVYLTLKFMREKFEMLANPQILKFTGGATYKFWKPYDHLIKRQAHRSGIIQDLFFLSRTLKQNISLKNIDALMYVDETIFKQNKHYNYMNEREKNNQLFQSVNLAEGIYIPLIKFIKIVGKKEISEEHTNILLSIYQYLTLLCFNNLEVKQVLMMFIPDILPHLSRKVGASNFLYEVSINNKLLVNNDEMVDVIIDGALEACLSLTIGEYAKTILLNRELSDKQDQNQYEKSKILYALRGILLFNEEGNKKNQEKLMNKLQDNTYRGLIFTYPTPYCQKIENFNLSPKQFYISTIFELFSVLVESKNSINIGKLENVHKHPYLLQCLKQTNRWQIRRSIRAYMNRLYYVNKDRDIFLFEEFIREEFSIINKEFYDLIELHKSRMLTDDLKIEKGIRFYYAKSEVMLMILQLMITLHEMFLKDEFVRMLKARLRKEQSGNDKKVHDYLIKLLKNLGCMNILYPKTKPISPFIREIKKLMVGPLSVIDLRYLEKRSEPEANMEISEADDIVEATTGKYIYDHSKTFFRNLHDMIRDLKSKEKMAKIRQLYRRKKELGEKINQSEQRQRLIDLIFSVPGETTLKPFNAKGKNIPKALQANPYISTSNSKIFHLLARRQLGQNDQNIQLNRKLSTVKEMVDDLPTFKKFKEDQFYKLVSIFSNLDATSLRFYTPKLSAIGQKGTEVFPFDEIVSTTFELIRTNPSQFKDTDKIFVIRLIRCYITEAVEKEQDYKLPIDTWDEYEDSIGADALEEFKTRQTRIQLCGGSAFIAEIFKQNFASGRLQLLNQALLLGISYLFTGNTTCQNSLLQVLKSDPENLMMINMNKIINSIGEFLINIRKIKEGEKKRDFAYQIVDTYDYYSLEENNIMKEFGHSKMDKFQIQTEMNYEKALCRTFRFMQLFCENNNIDMKNFIYEQVEKEGNKKNGTINFILTTTSLLRSIFKAMNNKLATLPKSLLDFLTETTQTPCLKNQVSLMKSTFIEDVSCMAEYFYKDQNNLLNRKFNKIPQGDNDPLHRLTEIYEMAMSMILINFEGNDQTLVWQFLSKCQPVFFWQIIKQNLLQLLQPRAKQWGITIEDQGEDNTELVKALFQAFDQTKIRELIEEQQENQMNYEGPMDVIIRTLCIFKKVNDFADIKNEQINRDKQNASEDLINEANIATSFKLIFIQIAKKQFPDIWIFLQRFQELILQIQISADNGEVEALQKIYFVNQPVFSYLSDNTRDHIMAGVERETQRDKLRTLLEYREEVNNEIEVNYLLQYNTFNIPWVGEKKFPITSKYTSSIRLQAELLSCAIIITTLIFVFVDHDMDQKSSIFTYNSILEMLIIKTMCIVQLLLTIACFYLWLRMRKPLALKKMENEESSSGLESQEQKTGDDDLGPPEPNDGWGVIANMISNYWSSFTFYFGVLTGYLTESRPYMEVVRPLIALWRYESAQFAPLLVFLFASLAGNYYGVEWFTIHIFDFFVSISILANVFKSVFQNIQLLTMLSLLAGCFVLVFNVIALGTYTPVMWEDQLPAVACEEIVGCVLFMWNSGPVGGDMEQFQPARFLFDVGYMVFMEMMFQNIVGGLMMDTYAALGEKDNEIEEDKKQNCYICGLNKPGIQKIKENFYKHTRRRHFLWNYIYYVYSLQKKSPTDYSGIQYKVKAKIDKENVTWFPSLGEDEGPDLQALMGDLEGQIQAMNEKGSQIVEKNKEYVDTANKTIKVIGNKNKELKPIEARR